MKYGSRLPILGNFSALVATQLFGRLIRFAYLIAIARLLEPEEVGLYSYGVAFYLTFLLLALFGQETLLSNRVAGHRNRFSTTAAHSLSITLLMISITAVLAFIFLIFTESDAATLQVLSFFILALIARGLASWVRGCFIALEQASWIPRYELTFRSLEAITGVVCLVFGGGLLAICFVHFVFWAVEAAASFMLLTRHEDFRLRLGSNWRLLKGIFSISVLFSVNIWLLGVFSQLGIVGLQLVQPDTAVVAYFAIAMQFFTTLMIFPVSLTQAIVPGLSRAYRNQTEADLQTVATAMKATLIIGSMVAVVANAIGPWIVTTLFGERYEMAGHTFGWICWSIGPYAAVFMTAQALNALGAKHMGALTALAMVVGHVGVTAVLLGLGQWTVGGLIGGPIESTVAGLLAGAFLGSIVGLTALGSKVNIAGHGWWLKPMILSAIPVLIIYIIPLPKPISGILSLLLLFALTWQMRVFSRTELERIAGRLRTTRSGGG